MERYERYEKKIISDVIKNRIENQKKEMVRKEKDYFPKAEEIENKIKILCKEANSLQIVYYIIFAKEIMKLLGKHKTTTMLEELEILQQKWELRGLDELLMERIKENFVPMYVPDNIFKLNISLLDGEKVLK